MSVIGHRRHRKSPQCDEVPWLIGADGQPMRANPDMARTNTPAWAKVDDEPAEAYDPPVDPLLAPPPWLTPAKPAADPPSAAAPVPPAQPALEVAPPPLPPPPPPLAPRVVGKATVPTPDPRMVEPPPPPVFTLQIKISAGVAQLWDYSLQEGYTGTFDEWVDEAIRLNFLTNFGVAPMIVPVAAEAMAG
jgi:hypothetical protein